MEVEEAELLESLVWQKFDDLIERRDERYSRLKIIIFFMHFEMLQNGFVRDQVSQILIEQHLVH